MDPVIDDVLSAHYARRHQNMYSVPVMGRVSCRLSECDESGHKENRGYCDEHYANLLSWIGLDHVRRLDHQARVDLVRRNRKQAGSSSLEG